MAVQLSHPDWFSVFHSHRRLAERFGVDRCFLIGDAAHLFSPVGAQGMNTGMQDAHNLAWKIAFVLDGKAQPKILQTYENERKQLAKRISKYSDWFFKLAASGRGFRLVRLKLLPVFFDMFLPPFSNPAIARFIFKKVSGTGTSYRKNPGLIGGFSTIGFKPGDRFSFISFQPKQREKKQRAF